MNIVDIDKDLKKFSKNGLFKKFDFPNEKFLLLGGYYDKDFGFIKVPQKEVKHKKSVFAWGTKCTAGVRVLFSTNSKNVLLTGTMFSKCEMEKMTYLGSVSFTLCEIVKGKEVFVCDLYPSIGTNQIDFIAQSKLKGNKVRDYILYFPLSCAVSKLSIGFDKKSIVQPYEKYLKTKPILYYGSSNTQGICANRANSCYQSLVAEWSNIDYYILEEVENAEDEEKMERFLSNFNCSVFVYDYGYGALSIDYLAKRHLSLYKKFRSIEKNKNTPIIFVTRPSRGRNSKDALRYEIIKATYEYAQIKGDKNVYFIDGKKLYPKDIKEHCLVDGYYLTDLGFYFFAKKVYKIIEKIVAKEEIGV